ncbi:MAG: heparinase II/III family protein, partial [bacterium]
MDPKIGGELIENYILNLSNTSTGLEPYPISLRGINWIKFISKFSSSHPHIFSPSQLLTFSSSLYAQYQILLDNLEYHLMGNHLLENGFSLLFGGFYFKEEELYEKARQIIIEQLKEQILNDGGHFELSPMYHQIILDRLLDCINLVQNN